MLNDPAAFVLSASCPIAVFLNPHDVSFSARYQIAVLEYPPAIVKRASPPIPTFAFHDRSVFTAPKPIPRLLVPRKCIIEEVVVDPDQISNLLCIVCVPIPTYHPHAIGLLFASTPGFM